MSDTANSRIDPDALSEFEAMRPGPPEEEFWERYNRRLEFPLSTVAAVLLHVLIAVVIIRVLLVLAASAPDRSSVDIKMVPEMGGLDDDGGGMAGSGGAPDPLAKGENDPWKANAAVLPDASTLPKVQEDLRKAINLDEPGVDAQVSAANAAQYEAVDVELKKKLLGIGVKKGSGAEGGKGFDGSKGTGPGGAGANSSRARSLRWVMRFSTADGQDYVAQLAAMGAVILVPLPPENKDCLYFADLKNRDNRKMATAADINALAGQIKFSDTRAESVRGVCDALGVREAARSFWAFFPRGLEDELSRKETNYRNRKAEDIEETVYRVIARGGTYEIIVDDQTPKR